MEQTRITWRLAGVLALAAALGACGDGAERPAQRPPPSAATDPTVRLQEFAVPDGSHPHDVAPAGDGTVWSAPHGVIVGPDGAAWITDGGLNAIVRVDPATEAVRRFPLPGDRPAVNLNTATFDRRGVLWFTGQGGVYGSLDPRSGRVRAFDAPRGAGPYGIATTPDGGVWYASLAGSHIAGIDLDSGKATVLEPPTPGQGARRVWSDSKGRLWVSEWNAGRLGRYDPAAERWREWELPGQGPQPYAVYVDDRDLVWLSDFAANALVRFDPATERFASFPLPTADGRVRQLLGRRGELWGAESAVDKLVVAHTS